MPDTFVLKCPHCEQALKLSDAHRGKRVKCRGCEKVLAVPPAKAPAPPQPQASVKREMPKSALPSSANPYATFDDNELSGPGGGVSDAIITELRKTKPWVRLIGFLAAVGLILTAVVLAIGTLASVMGPGAMRGPAILGLGLQLGALVLYFLTAKFLIGYSRSIGKLEETGSSEDLIMALANQRKFWTMQGVLILIAVVVGLLLAVASIMIGTLSF